MRACPHCGELIGSNASTCFRCGAYVPTPPTPQEDPVAALQKRLRRVNAQKYLFLVVALGSFLIFGAFTSRMADFLCAAFFLLGIVMAVLCIQRFRLAWRLADEVVLARIHHTSTPPRGTPENPQAVFVSPFPRTSDPLPPKKVTSALHADDNYVLSKEDRADIHLATAAAHDAQMKELEDKYYTLLPQMMEKFSAVTKAKAYHSADADAVERMCWQMMDAYIQLAPKWKKYYGDASLKEHPYKRLAMLMERQGRYEEAVSVCDEAIRIGLTADGTKGGMVGRRERLLKRHNQLCSE